MACTAFLSLWISNGAVTGMMLPIIDAILIEMIKGIRTDKKKKQKSIEHHHNDHHWSSENGTILIMHYCLNLKYFQMTSSNYHRNH